MSVDAPRLAWKLMYAVCLAAAVPISTADDKPSAGTPRPAIAAQVIANTRIMKQRDERPTEEEIARYRGLVGDESGRVLAYDTTGDARGAEVVKVDADERSWACTIKFYTPEQTAQRTQQALQEARANADRDEDTQAVISYRVLPHAKDGVRGVVTFERIRSGVYLKMAVTRPARGSTKEAVSAKALPRWRFFYGEAERLGLFGPEAPQVAVKGRLGDVFKVDLSGVLKGSLWPRGEQRHDFEVTLPQGFRMALDRNGVPITEDVQVEYLLSMKSKRKLSRTRREFADSGVFYLIPHIPNDGAAGAKDQTLTASFKFTKYVAEDDSGELKGERIEGTLRIELGATYSTTGDNAIANNDETLDIYRQRQRLRYLGFPDRNGALLQVKGTRDIEMQWAIGLFNLVPKSGRYGRVSDANDIIASFFDEDGEKYINAVNAPRWAELSSPRPSSDTGFGIKPTSERWATSWAQEVLADAGRKWVARRTAGSAPNLFVSAASVQQGGPCSHSSHQAGMDLDIETPSKDAPKRSGSGADPETPFFAVKDISGVKYVAAAGGKVIVEQADGTYAPADPTASGFDATKALKASAAWENQAILAQIATHIVDPPGYDHTVVRAHIEAILAARAPSGAAVVSILYNDPRMWDLGRVRFFPGHGGHLHVDIQAPPPRR